MTRLEKIVEKLERMENEVRAKGRFELELKMKKFVMDENFENDVFKGDVLSITIPDKRIQTKDYMLIAVFAKKEYDKVYHFGSLMELANFINKMY